MNPSIDGHQLRSAFPYIHPPPDLRSLFEVGLPCNGETLDVHDDSVPLYGELIRRRFAHTFTESPLAPFSLVPLLSLSLALPNHESTSIRVHGSEMVTHKTEPES